MARATARHADNIDEFDTAENAIIDESEFEEIDPSAEVNGEADPGFVVIEEEEEGEEAEEPKPEPPPRRSQSRRSKRQSSRGRAPDRIVEEEPEEIEELEAEEEAEAEAESEEDWREDQASSVKSLNLKICIALGVVVLLAAAALIAQRSNLDGSQKSAEVQEDSVPPPLYKPAITLTPATGKLTLPSDWKITKVGGAYRANGKRIMGNWTLRDANDNVQFLTAEEKAALGLALNAFDSASKLTSQ